MRDEYYGDYSMVQMLIPPLPRHCGSWIIVNRATGKAICETVDRSFVESIGDMVVAGRIEVLTAAEYLGRLNATIREGR